MVASSFSMMCNVSLDFCCSAVIAVSMVGAIEQPNRLMVSNRMARFLTGMEIPVDVTLM
ncbi:hypothetical protein D3C71_2179750 [compost metagenome]